MTATETAPTIHDVTTCPTGMTTVQVVSGDFDSAKMHWSTAMSRGLLVLEALYYVPVVDDFASQRHIAAIEKLHPGKDLIYL